MFIRIESSSGLPITRQITDQIRSHCASGTLVPGDRMPSVRQLAKELLVNQNTILRVYERLTTEGLLERRQGDGTYVSATLPRGRIKAQRDLFSEEMDRLSHRALDLGINSKEFHALIDEALGRLAKERSTPRKGNSNE